MPLFTPRVALASFLIAGLVLTPAAVAAADVTISPNTAQPNEFLEFSFRVSNESDNASTVSVSIALPEDALFTDVKYRPLAGWATEVVVDAPNNPVGVDEKSIAEAPTHITWTAEDGLGITNGQYEQFVVLVGPVPSAGSVRFPTTQTYSDGTTVEWAATDEEAAANGSLKAGPVLYINDPVPVVDNVAAAPTTNDFEEDASTPDTSMGEIVMPIALVALFLSAFAIGLAVYLGIFRRNGATNV